MATAGNELQWAIDLAWPAKAVVEILAKTGGYSEQEAADGLLATINGVEEFDEGKFG